MTEQWTFYVRKQDVADFYELGWIISSFFDGRENHGAYSVIMQWAGRGEHKVPDRGAGENPRLIRSELDDQPAAKGDIPGAAELQGALSVS
jgi:hypothetical protein